MSITAETAKEHANDPAVLCCRAEEGITIQASNLEDPAIFDEILILGVRSPRSKMEKLLFQSKKEKISI